VNKKEANDIADKVLVDVPDKFKYDGQTIRRLVEYYAKKPNETENMIVACPRSGTRYMSLILQGVGVDMPHEYIGKDGTVSWQHIVGKKYLVKCNNILHQTREPLATISSIACTLNKVAYPFLLYGAPLGNLTANDIDDDKIKLRFAMHVYEEWNNLIEKRSNWRFKIEDMPHIIGDVGKKLGYYINLRYDYGNKLNSIDHSKITWDDLGEIDQDLAHKIAIKAEKYGYL
jgi:hypothetical protein